MTLYAKRKAGFHNMRPERARALSCRGTRTVVELANDYAHTYAPFIRAAVREVGHNYRQVAIDSPGSDSSSSTLDGKPTPLCKGHCGAVVDRVGHAAHVVLPGI
jgi:hypothetical protein